jgi:hypothetical protein
VIYNPNRPIESFELVSDHTMAELRLQSVSRNLQQWSSRRPQITNPTLPHLPRFSPGFAQASGTIPKPCGSRRYETSWYRDFFFEQKLTSVYTHSS